MPPDHSSQFLPVFAGNVRHVVDENHRVTVPSRWRHPGLSSLYAMPDPRNPLLILMTAEEMEKLRLEAENDPTISKLEARDFVRLLFGSASPCPMDKQGRLVLPAEECSRFGLYGEVMLIGSGSRIEVWNPEQWEAKQEQARSTLIDVADRIGF